jgi:DNA-binding IclR family transcriptional regulator
VAEIAQTADRALSLLEELARTGGQSPTELAEHMAVDRTIVSRLLNTLRRRGFVVREGSGYLLGPSLRRMASLVYPELCSAAVPAMTELARTVGRPVVLYVEDRDAVVVLERAEAGSAGEEPIGPPIGCRHGFLERPAGIVLAAFAAPFHPARLALEGQASRPLRAELTAARADGFAVTRGRRIRAVAEIAAPIISPDGGVPGCVAILAGQARGDDLRPLAGPLTAAARGIAAELSAQPPAPGARRAAPSHTAPGASAA